MITLIPRDHCVISGLKDLEHLHTFKDFPVFLGCTDTDEKSDLFADMPWWISQGSGSIQLNPLVDLKVLYQSSHNESVGKIWRDHHQSFACFVAQSKARNVLEIGGAHGILAKNFLDQDPNATWVLVDPNPHPSEHPRLGTIKSFFGADTDIPDHVDTIVHSHVAEHIYDPIEFFSVLHRLLGSHRKHVFSIPNLSYLFEQGYTNALNFEHTFYLTEEVLEYFLKKSGFEILRKEFYLNHSIFYDTRPCKPDPKTQFESQYQKNKSVFQNFLQMNLSFVKDINDRMHEHSGDVFVFGAHIFTQFLFAFGLEKARILGVLDNGPLKIGRRLYGTSFMVKKPDILASARSPAVILRAAGYNSEIKDAILSGIRKDVIFWE